MQPDEATPFLGSARAVRIVGVLLGLAIMGGVTYALAEDHASRLEGARRHSQAVAASTDRLLKYGLRSIERAMRGAAGDAGALFRTAAPQAPRLLDEAIAGVLSRLPELESLALYDGQGRAITRGAAEPTLPRWTASARRGQLVFGPLQQASDGAWLLPVALRTPEGNWLARLRTSEIQRMIAKLEVGRDDSILVLDRSGTVLASSTDGAHVGRGVRLPDVGTGAVTFEQAGELDRIERSVTFSAGSGYPLIVAAGIGRGEARAHWLEHVVSATAAMLLYWLGLLYLVRRLEAHEKAREAMLDELQANADWLRQAQQTSGTGVWRLESEEGHIRVSAHAAELFGFEPTAGTYALNLFFERMHPEDRARVEAEFEAARRQRTPFQSEYRIVLPGGRVRWIKARGALATDSRGLERMTGTIVDITERQAAMERIERAESQFRLLFERNPLPFWVFDARTLRFLAVNDAAIRSYGYSREEFLAMTILDIRPPEDVEAVLESVRRGAKADEGEQVWTHLTRDGRRFEVCVHGSSIEFAGRPARLVLAEDVSERLAYERDLAWRATHDTTTGMLTVETLVRKIDAASASGYVVAYVRLRDLELVAPTLGRNAGETILLEAAERFSEVGRMYGHAAYRPGESFVVVALDAARGDEMLDSLVRATATPVETGNASHPLEASIGLAVGPMHGGGAEQVIGNAALAALQARREGMAVMRFDATMATEAGERLELAARLRHALEKREFELHFQPVHRLSDGRATSLEALLRWPSPEGSFVPPQQFIPLCEESGLIVPLGEWVLEEAARCHNRLAAQGHGMPIAVNVSAVQFLSESLPATLRELRRKHALPPGALQVELTESAVLRRPEAARAAMQELREEGVRISIDDFGTGFSSMAYLKNLPVDFLKIDRAFVADVHRDPRDAAICSALIGLGHSLGLQVVAEGVECEEQLDWLRAHGCDHAQGHLFGSPAPVAEVLLSAKRWAA